jgi:hypothetical protein
VFTQVAEITEKIHNEETKLTKTNEEEKMCPVVRPVAGR